MATKRDHRHTERLNDARALVRDVLTTDLGQTVSNKKINEAAEKVLRALPETDETEGLTA